MFLQKHSKRREVCKIKTNKLIRKSTGKMDETNDPKCNGSLRPRYGLIIATSFYNNDIGKEICEDDVEGKDKYSTFLSKPQWLALCKRLSRQNWTHMWNQTTPASWTFPPTVIESSPKPKIFPADSPQLIDILHALLDGLPGNKAYFYQLFLSRRRW